ncbi:MAG: SBBP repeat-containing protein [Promethearchaeota archaeon]
MKINKFAIILIGFILFFGLFSTQINNTNYVSRENGKKSADSSLSISNNAGCEWNRTWDKDGEDVAIYIKIDSSDNIYVTGASNFQGSGMSLFLLKYNSSGNLQWNRTWAVTGDTLGYGIAFDSLDNIYVTGMSFNPPLVGPSSILLKYNSEGVLDWYRQFVIGDNSICSGIAIDSSNNIFLSGVVIFGTNEDILLVKCNNEGFVQWNRTWGGANQDVAFKIALDSLDNIYLAGTIDYFGGDSDICLVKYDSSGNKLWHSIRDEGNADMGWNVALDSSDDIYLVGSSGSFGSTDACLIKFNSSGHHQWNRTWGGSNDDFVMGLEIDSSDNVFIGGSIDIAGFPMYGITGDISLINYDNSGQYQWNYTRRTSHHEGCHSIALDSSEENIYLAGCSDEFGTNDTLVIKYHLEKPGGGKEAIPGYNTILIFVIYSSFIAYFIKKRWKK